MSAYTRFLNGEKISKQFWACRPRNPTCGLISLERGTKIFLWTSLFACTVYALRLAQLLVEAQRMRLSESELQDLKDYLKKNPHNYSIELPLHPILEWFSKFIVCSLFWFYSWRLLQVILAKDIPKLKSRFIIMCLINFVWFPMFYFEIMGWGDYLSVPHILWFPAMGLTLLFEIIGMGFTYSFISNLISPNREDDTSGGVIGNV